MVHCILRGVISSGNAGEILLCKKRRSIAYNLLRSNLCLHKAIDYGPSNILYLLRNNSLPAQGYGPWTIDYGPAHRATNN